MSFYAAITSMIIRIRYTLISGIIAMMLAASLITIYCGEPSINMVFSIIGVALSLVFVSIDS